MSNKKTLWFFFFILLIGSGLTSCKKGVSLSETDFKDLYSSNIDVPQPEFRVFHSAPGKTEVHFAFDNRTLAYGTKNNAQRVMASTRVKYEVYSNYESIEILDSSSMLMIDTMAIGEFKYLYGVFTLSLADGQNYIIKIITEDQNNGHQNITFIDVNKIDPTHHQYFKVTLAENNSILFRNYFYSNEKIIIEYAGSSPHAELKGKHYAVSFPVSERPYSLSRPEPFDFDNYTPFSIPFINGKAEFLAGEPGIYHLGIDTDKRYSGITFFQYSDEFPEVNTAQELLDPLQLITSSREYKKLMQYQSQKLAVDEFWIRTSPDPLKAKKLIKGFYNRVQMANNFFTSFKEGWKTDRGTVFIIFGPPAIVYRSLTGESWTYGEESNYQSLTFNFSRNPNPFTNNDFTLQRSTLYKNPYYRAVDAWRQGKVANLGF